ncbi:MAG: C69 family dipeptidase, partial [Alloprevotella sp.]|nr:C69 family dipeptidase [Alloprevotella sp.]
MIKQITTAAIALCTLVWATPSTACTNFLVGKKASADGSTFITYNADSYGMFGRLVYYPAAQHAPGTMRQIYDGDTNEHHGQIAEAPVTYSVMGNINEHQVAITETTFGGREELVDTAGIIDYVSLMAIALQRSKTAREAIAVMTSLVQEYGYASSGESFSIADPNEVWILEMIGKGSGRRGTVWVAVRIPDDCIAVHANQSRIHKFDLKDKRNVLYSKDVISFAR